MSRTRQPQGAARIDWSNPLVRLLALAYVGGQRIDVVKQRTATFDADVSVEPVSYGLATRTPVSNGVSFGTGPVITGSSGAVVCLANPTSSGTNYSAAFSQRSTSPNRQFGLLFNSSGVYVSAGSLEAYMFDGTAIPFRTSISNTVIDGKWHSYGANFNGGYFSLFVDGAILDSSSPNEQSVGSCVDASQIVNIGTLAGSSVNGADYKTAFLGVWNRLLSTDEYRSLSENPWQLFASPRRLWIQLGAASGGAGATTETTLSTTVSAVSTIASLKMRLVELLATVAAAFTGLRAVSVTRSAASTASAATTRAIATVKSATATAGSVLARAVGKIVSTATSTVATIANQVTSGAQTFYRELTAAATAGALAVRQANLTQSATATASAAYTCWIWVTKSAVRSATATQTSIKVKLQQLITTPLNVVATATRAIATTRLASAVLSASATFRVGVYLSAAASAVATRLAAVAHTFSVATATAAATVTTLKVKLKNLATDVVSTAATLTRQTLAERVATLAGTATAQRAISSTLAATQPVAAVAVKAISKTLAVAASALATLVRQLLSGSFWSADRTYTIAAAPRTYTIAAAPRTYTV